VSILISATISSCKRDKWVSLQMRGRTGEGERPRLLLFIVRVESQADSAERELLDKRLSDLIPGGVMTASFGRAERGPVAVVEEHL
jgi:hypothetical protein